MNFKAIVSNLLKNSKVLYRLYYSICNLIIKAIGLFVKCDSSLIVFVSFGGKKMNDSPWAIYNKMLTDNRFDNYRLVWALQKPDKYHLNRGEIIRIDTLRYFVTLLRARVWVTNSSVNRGLKFRGRNVYYFNTWHGTPIKYMGGDIKSIKDELTIYTEPTIYDVFLAQSEYDADIFKRNYNIPDQVMKILGLPRNDELINDAGEDRRKKLRERLSIPSSKKVILYAPTFREYQQDSLKNCVLAPPVDLKKWKEKLGSDFVLLFRAHYEVAKTLNLIESDFIKDVSSYQNLNELMIVSDILISDYSSIFFDYSIMDKPMLCFAYDYQEYSEKRGLYFDIRKELRSESLDNEDSLINEILNLDNSFRKNITKRFREKYVKEYGTATAKSVDLIYKNISQC